MWGNKDNMRLHLSPIICSVGFMLFKYKETYFQYYQRRCLQKIDGRTIRVFFFEFTRTFKTKQLSSADINTIANKKKLKSSEILCAIDW